MKNSQSKFANKKSSLGSHTVKNPSSSTGGCCCGSKLSEEINEIDITESEEK